MLTGDPTNLPLRFLFFLPALLLGFIVHELAHGYAALAQGDDTARRQGRLTLNPRKLIEPWGLLLGILTGFGYPRELRLSVAKLPSQRARIGVALAGPVANLALAVLASLLLKLVTPAEVVPVGGTGLPIAVIPVTGCTLATSPVEIMRTFLATLYTANLLLMGFNLLPFPPLDGFEVTRWLLRHRDPALLFRLETNSQLALLVLVAVVVILRPVVFWMVRLTATPTAALLGVPLVFPCP